MFNNRRVTIVKRIMECFHFFLMMNDPTHPMRHWVKRHFSDEKGEALDDLP